MSVTPSERAREIAERMVMVFPEELGSEDYGSISIGPHRDEKQPWHAWQLWVRFPDGQTAHKCAVDIRGWICDAIAAALTIPPGHVRDEHGVDFKVVRSVVVGKYPSDCVDRVVDVMESGQTVFICEAAEAARGGGA